jgi:hypothetical protein
MNLSSVPDRTPAEIRLLVEEAVRKIDDSTIVEGLRTFLVPPREEMRTWDWQKPHAEYPVWVVAESSQYDYGIVFSDYGFAPERPWGLVFSSHANFDADYVGIPVWKKRTRNLGSSRSSRKGSRKATKPASELTTVIGCCV